jgi:hypothetical protein
MSLAVRLISRFLPIVISGIDRHWHLVHLSTRHRAPSVQLLYTATQLLGVVAVLCGLVASAVSTGFLRYQLLRAIGLL